MRVPARLPLSALAAALALLAGALVAPAAHAAAAFTWIGGTGTPAGDGHSWTDPDNWSGHQVPTTGSAVTVAPPSLGECYVYVRDIPTISLASLSLADLPDTGTSVCSASLDDGHITVTGSLDWRTGAVSGDLAVAAGATGTIHPVPGANATSSLYGHLVVAGTVTVADTTFTADLDQSFDIAAGADVRVAPGGRLATSGATDIRGLSCCDDPPRIVDQGTVAIGGSTRVHAVELDQDATLTVNGGSSLVTDSAPTTAHDATYTGAGAWRLGPKTVTTLTGTQHVGPAFHLVLGGARTDSTETLGGRFTLTAGTLDWQGGYLSANTTIAHGATLHASGPAAAQDPRALTGRDAAGVAAVTVTVRGTLAVANRAAVLVVDHPHVTVANGGVLAFGAGTSLGSAVIGNSGTLTAPAGVRTTAALTNAGLLRLGGPLSVAALTQTTAGRAAFTLTAHGGAVVRAAGTARIGGSLTVRDDTYRPSGSSRRTVVTAGTALRSTLRCVVTLGTGATGPKARHWTTSATARTLALRSVTGARTHC